MKNYNYKYTSASQNTLSINPILDTRIFVQTPCVMLRGPPWILKRAGLESSGQRLISSIGKTKRIEFFLFLLKKSVYFQILEIFYFILFFFFNFFSCILVFFWEFLCGSFRIFWIFFPNCQRLLFFLGVYFYLIFLNGC